MNFKNLITLMSATLISTSVYAGQAYDSAVEINVQDMTASGNMVTARFSKNEEESIGCGIRHIASINEETGITDVVSYGFCQARTGIEEEQNGFCSTQNEEMLAAMNGINDYSYVTFSWNEFGECTRIGSSTQSFYIPNFKLKKAK